MFTCFFLNARRAVRVVNARAGLTTGCAWAALLRQAFSDNGKSTAFHVHVSPCKCIVSCLEIGSFLIYTTKWVTILVWLPPYLLLSKFFFIIFCYSGHTLSGNFKFLLIVISKDSKDSNLWQAVGFS